MLLLADLKGENMFRWQSENTHERFLQLKNLLLSVSFRVSIDNVIKLYGIDRKHKQILINESLLSSANCSNVEKLLKDVDKKKFVKEIEQEL